MSKYHKIRWQESDLNELERTVRNFNAKVNRIASKNPQIKNLLPEKVEVAKLKQLINTRQDLNREINALKRFTNRKNIIKQNEDGTFQGIVTVPDNDYNLQTTKWQYTEMNRRVGIINRRRKQRLNEIQNLEATSRGKPLGYSVGAIGMGKAYEISLNPMNSFTRRMTPTDLKYKWKAIQKESSTDYFTKKDYQLRENAINTILTNYNPEDVGDIIDIIKNMDIQEFLNKFLREPNYFEFFYPPNQEQYESYLTALKSTWNPSK